MNLETPKKHYRIPDENLRFEKVIPPKGGKSYKRNDHADHANFLLQRSSVVRTSLAQKEDYHWSKHLFLNIRSPQSTVIKSEKTKLKALGFEILSLNKLHKNVCLAKISKDNFDILQDKIKRYATDFGNPGKTNLAILDDIEEVEAEDKLSGLKKLQDDLTVIIYLYNSLSQKERFVILNRLESEFQKLSIETESQVFANGTTALSCKADYSVLENIAKSYSTVNKVELNSSFFIKRSLPASKLPGMLTVNPPISNSIVAIIDSGIESSSIPFRSLVTTNLRYLPKSAVDVDQDHGTFVASRCLYGDEIDSCLSSNVLTPYCKVMDVTVFGKDKLGRSVGPDDFSLMNIIGEVVKKHHAEIKVYNLSLGKPEPIKDFDYSEVAKQIDYLSKMYGVIFIVASGNIDVPLGVYPHDHFGNNGSRLGSPAESLLAITVGSIAKYDNLNCLAVKNEISPFSRIGPGADGGLKPEIVTHGGNLDKGYKATARTSSYGINNTGHELAIDVGTSFSAPLVSQYVVRLIDAFPEATTNLIKALLYHFAQKRSIPSTLINPHNFYTGFGEPDIEHSLISAPNAFSYFFEGAIDQTKYQYIGFHIPTIFKTDISTKLKVKVTVVFDPSVNPINDLEYSMARISATLFKAQGTEFKEINVDADQKYNLPWNPILQFEKEFTRGFSCGYWELRLRLFTRGTLTNKYVQYFAVIIEVIDSNNKVDVYKETLKEFGNKYQIVRSKGNAA
ncbi:S8 family peptidase [Pedobacter sp. KLB.chiD]|uniref:S8 family peptidase n=1 Tax=Pedobacter sp. KLB.chiD TaxID=3387402 RepID=UPI00399BD361